MSKHTRIQPRVKGVTRVPGSMALLPELDAWVRREARLYHCSMAFVRANCVSFTSGIPMVSYRELERKSKRPMPRLVVGGRKR